MSHNAIARDGIDIQKAQAIRTGQTHYTVVFEIADLDAFLEGYDGLEIVVSGLKQIERAWGFPKEMLSYIPASDRAKVTAFLGGRVTDADHQRHLDES